MRLERELLRAEAGLRNECEALERLAIAAAITALEAELATQGPQILALREAAGRHVTVQAAMRMELADTRDLLRRCHDGRRRADDLALLLREQHRILAEAERASG